MTKASDGQEPKKVPKIGKQGEYYSRYRGVSYHKLQKRWQATIKIKGKLYHLGVFDTEMEAADAYDEAALDEYGDQAILNRDMRAMYWMMKETTGKDV